MGTVNDAIAAATLLQPQSSKIPVYHRSMFWGARRATVYIYTSKTVTTNSEFRLTKVIDLNPMPILCSLVQPQRHRACCTKYLFSELVRATATNTTCVWQLTNTSTTDKKSDCC